MFRIPFSHLDHESRDKNSVLKVSQLPFELFFCPDVENHKAIYRFNELQRFTDGDVAVLQLLLGDGNL